MSINFNCTMNLENTVEKWNGKITKITKYGSHYELKIESRSGFIVIIGNTDYGNFACIPDFNAGCHLSNLKDIFWNSERLCSVINAVDGITVACALQAVADYVDLE